jgi:hypothetical protein
MSPRLPLARPPRTLTALHVNTPTRRLVLRCIGEDPAGLIQKRESLRTQRLREHVRELVFRRDVVHRDDVAHHVLADEVVPDVDVLGPHIVPRVAASAIAPWLSS